MARDLSDILGTYGIHPDAPSGRGANIQRPTTTSPLPVRGGAVETVDQQQEQRVREAVQEVEAEVQERRVAISEEVSTAVADAVSGNVGGDTTVQAAHTPTKPTGLAASGATVYVILSWDRPIYQGHSRTEIWRGPTSNFADAAFLASAVGGVATHSDYVGAQADFYYWLRHVNVEDEAGPYSDPVNATTAVSIDLLVDALAENYGVLARDTTDKQALRGVRTTTGATDENVRIVASSFSLVPPVDYTGPDQPANPQLGEIWSQPQADGSIRYLVWEPGGWVVMPSITPFVVVTERQTIGDYVVEPGVYMAQNTVGRQQVRDLAVDAAKIAKGTLTDAEIGSLNAGKIVAGILQSHGFDNSEGSSGWLLGIGEGQNNVRFIVRSAGLEKPALELGEDGNLIMQGAAIRGQIKSDGFDTRTHTGGFKLDADTGEVEFRQTTGAPALTIDEDGQTFIQGGNIGGTLQSEGYSIYEPGWQISTGNVPEGVVGYGVGFTIRGPGGRTLFNLNSRGVSSQLLGSFAWLRDKIGAANISTYMEAAAIGAAYLGTASVETLKIKNNAVTVPTERSSNFPGQTHAAGNGFDGWGDLSRTPIGVWTIVPGGVGQYLPTAGQTGTINSLLRPRIEFSAEDGGRPSAVLMLASVHFEATYGGGYFAESSTGIVRLAMGFTDSGTGEYRIIRTREFPQTIARRAGATIPAQGMILVPVTAESPIEFWIETTCGVGHTGSRDIGNWSLGVLGARR